MLFWRSDRIKIRTLKLVKGNGFRIVFVVQNEFCVAVVEVNGIYKAVNQCLFRSYNENYLVFVV